MKAYGVAQLIRVGAEVTERSHPAHNESLPGKCTTSFTCSRLGRFLCGGRIKYREMTELFFARTGSQPDFTRSHSSVCATPA